MIMAAWFSKTFCCDEAEYFKSSGEAAIPMAVLPLPPPPTNAPLPPWRWQRGSGRFFWRSVQKLHVSEQKFNVRKYKTMRLDESYRLVTTVLVLNSQWVKIHNNFLTTIVAAAWSRHSYFWSWRGRFCVFITVARGGALAFFF